MSAEFSPELIEILKNMGKGKVDPSIPTEPPSYDPVAIARWAFWLALSANEDPHVEDETLVSEPDLPEFSPIVRGDRLDLNISTPMLVQDVIPREGVALMYAEPETGKTPVALDLALCVANGLSEWAGQAICTEGPQDVLFIAYEGGASVREYLRGWLREHPGSDLRHFWLLEDWEDPETGRFETIPPLVEKAFDSETRTWYYGAPFLDELTDWISGRFAPVLVIVDTQVDALGALDENNAPDTLALYSELRRWSSAFGHLTMFLHHTSKGGEGSKSYRGSTAFAGKADSMILLEKAKDRGAGKLSFTKAKGMKNAKGKRLYQGLRNETGDDYCVSWTPPSVAELAEDPEVVRRTNTELAILEMLATLSNGMQSRNPKPGWSTNEVHLELDRLKNLPGSEGRDVHTDTTKHVKGYLEDMAKDGRIIDLSPPEGTRRYWGLP
ncbi:MAG: AAA family ATPase [Propionibacteriales bacterium]|nr:AAA family ATPase [Propionibacteriales bacterium]